MKINFHNQVDDLLKLEIKAIRKALKKEKQNRSMEIIFVNSEIIKELNNKFRNINEVTDVLSFPSDDVDSLGDIFICVERAYEQAKDYGHSNIREFAFLAVHGYLHLLGYDHQTKEEEKIMFEIQEAILKKAKIERK